MSFRRRRRQFWVVHTRPTSALVLRRGDREVASWPLVSVRPDLAMVDGLARLQLLAARLGLSLHVRNPCQRLQELLDLAGLTEVIAWEGGDL